MDVLSSVSDSNSKESDDECWQVSGLHVDSPAGITVGSSSAND